MPQDEPLDDLCRVDRTGSLTEHTRLSRFPPRDFDVFHGILIHLRNSSVLRSWIFGCQGLCQLAILLGQPLPLCVQRVTLLAESLNLLVESAGFLGQPEAFIGQ